ncbi:hypothetical protein BD410DRAFT_807392 [Rickenella mellea]|uniref:Uncharacterized protein n=1 Tax=Rickenella mellea TaxID=50990 RepID=A0A4Y7PPI4_9AGAM|nr:hypothetical protein BD410DRAFT_807392 [Rickenella mellea]
MYRAAPRTYIRFAPKAIRHLSARTIFDSVITSQVGSEYTFAKAANIPYIHTNADLIHVPKDLRWMYGALFSKPQSAAEQCPASEKRQAFQGVVIRGVRSNLMHDLGRSTLDGVYGEPRWGRNTRRRTTYIHFSAAPHIVNHVDGRCDIRRVTVDDGEHNGREYSPLWMFVAIAFPDVNSVARHSIPSGRTVSGDNLGFSAVGNVANPFAINHDTDIISTHQHRHPPSQISHLIVADQDRSIGMDVRTNDKFYGTITVDEIPCCHGPNRPLRAVLFVAVLTRSIDRSQKLRLPQTLFIAVVFRVVASSRSHHPYDVHGLPG